MQNETPAVWAGDVVLGVLRGPFAEELYPFSPELQLVRVIDRMANFVPENAHAPFWGAPFDLEHLREFETRQAWMREIEGNGDPWNPVGGKPLVGQPVVWTKTHAACFKLACNAGDPPLELGSPDRQAEVADTQIQQALVGPSRPPRGAAIHGWPSTLLDWGERLVWHASTLSRGPSHVHGT
jgi:hypothetical protein